MSDIVRCEHCGSRDVYVDDDEGIVDCHKCGRLSTYYNEAYESGCEDDDFQP